MAFSKRVIRSCQALSEGKRNRLSVSSGVIPRFSASTSEKWIGMRIASVFCSTLARKIYL